MFISQILWQKYAKFNFAWDSAPDPAGELASLPGPPNQLGG